MGHRDDDDRKLRGVALKAKAAEPDRSLAILRATLDATLDATSDGIVAADAAGAITAFNERFLQLWSLPREVLETRDHDGVLHALRRHAAHPNEFIARIEEIGRDAPHETHDVIDLADGRVFERTSRTQFVDSQPVGRVWSYRDVSENRSAVETSRTLAAIVESSHDAIIGKTLESRIVSWNAGAERLFGYTAEEAVGQSVTMLIPRERLAEEGIIIERLRRGERVEHYETVRLRKDGTPVDISLTISPIRDAGGTIIGASKIARDITSRIQRERSARFLSDATATLADLTDSDSTLQKLATLAVPAFADWCAVDLAAPDGSLRRVAVTTSHPGAVQPNNVAANRYLRVPLRSRGKTIGALTFAMGESGRTYGAVDIAGAEDLGHRTVIAIENATLLAALRESDQRKDEFLAMLAHELRNPLAPIRNAVQLVRTKCPPSPEIRWAADVIDRQAHQMTRLVDDLLDVSRITRGKIDLRREQVDLAEAVTNAVEVSRPMIDKWGHELTISLPPEPIVLDADPTRIAQILQNLIHNAAKYTDQGGAIFVSVERAGNSAVIRVKDNGIGMSAALLPRVFDMFLQADRALERAKGGLGIGLTLVHRLVELHGGSVEAQSAGPGKGSEFIVQLPITTSSAMSGLADAGGALAAESKAARRILVVDDNHDAADSLGMLLRLVGNEVHTAYDGLEAVGAAAAFRPDIVLLDIGLPKLNGHEAARRIREQIGGNDILLIALTGWGQAEDQQRSKEAGFDHHMTKPVEFEALQSLLAEEDNKRE